MRFKLVSVLVSTLLLTACKGDSAIDGAKNIPNRFGNAVNALEDFSSGSTGDSSNARGLKPNEVRVTMEVPANIAPQAEATRRNLNIVVPERVTVYRTDHTLRNDIGSVSYTTATDDDGNIILTFDGGVPVGPDVVIEASYQGVTFKALAADADRDVKVNPFSHYLVEKGLGGYNAVDFQTVMNCVDSTLCLNRYVWGTVADQVHDFEIDIDSNASLATAMASLEARADFKAYVDAMADYALLGQDTSDSIRASSADYNSVFLGLELGQTFRESSASGAGQWGVRIAQEEPLTDTSTAYLYPALTLTSFEAFNINVTSLATDIPYDRQTMIHGFDGHDGHAFFNRSSDVWQRNSHASAPGAATITPPLQENQTDPARLLAGRALYQSITGRDSHQINGWTRNPYYLDAYTSAPSDDSRGPDRVLAGYFSAGKAIALENKSGKLKRREILEDHYLSVFELHLQRSDAFTLSVVEDSAYNLVYLTPRFGDAEDPVVFETGHGTWQTGSPDGDQLTASVALEHFQLVRNALGTVRTDSGSQTSTWRLANRLSRLSQGDRHIGRLSLFESERGGTFGRPDLGQGAATPDGSLLAFNLDDSYLGDGLIIAAKSTSAVLTTNARYRVQGAIVAMTDDTNTLYHLNNGVLELEGGDNASFSADGFQIRHGVPQNAVSAPESQNWTVTLSGASVSQSGAVTLSGGGITLQGFYTGAGDQLFLTLQDDTGPALQTGLLMATRIPDQR